MNDPQDLERARLEARVAALETALAARSRELKRIQAHCCPRDLAVIARIRAGLPFARFAYEPDLWQESTELVPAEVEPVLADLWRSLTPVEPEDG
jgi:hypothetical protein